MNNTEAFLNSGLDTKRFDLSCCKKPRSRQSGAGIAILEDYLGPNFRFLFFIKKNVSMQLTYNIILVTDKQYSASISVTHFLNTWLSFSRSTQDPR